MASFYNVKMLLTDGSLNNYNFKVLKDEDRDFPFDKSYFESKEGAAILKWREPSESVLLYLDSLSIEGFFVFYKYDEYWREYCPSQEIFFGKESDRFKSIRKDNEIFKKERIELALNTWFSICNSFGLTMKPSREVFQFLRLEDFELRYPLFHPFNHPGILFWEDFFPIVEKEWPNFINKKYSNE
jgi:hypothetical protein